MPSTAGENVLILLCLQMLDRLPALFGCAGNEDEAAPMDVEAAAKDGSKPAEADIEEGNAEDEKRDSPAEKESEQPAEEAVASHATVMESSQLEPQPEEKPANTTAEKVTSEPQFHRIYCMPRCT